MGETNDHALRVACPRQLLVSRPIADDADDEVGKQYLARSGGLLKFLRRLELEPQRSEFLNSTPAPLPKNVG